MNSSDILRIPISKLYLKHEFEWQCQEMGFGTLEDILALLPEELIATRGFSYRWLSELHAILEQHGLTHLLQTIPGKSPGRSG